MHAVETAMNGGVHVPVVLVGSACGADGEAGGGRVGQ